MKLITTLWTDNMVTYELIPYTGVPPVLLGMGSDEVRRAMVEVPDVPERTGKYSTGALLYHSAAFQVFFGGDGRVEYIELGNDGSLVVMYREVNVFQTRVDDLVARIARDAPFDPNEPEAGYSFTFPHLGLALWRPVLPEDEDDLDGQYFATIGIARLGYFTWQRP